MKRAKLTKNTKDLIKTAIENTGSVNRFVICCEVSKLLEDKYSKYGLEYLSKRKKMESTKKILESIDTYFYKYLKYEGFDFDEEDDEDEI